MSFYKSKTLAGKLQEFVQQPNGDGKFRERYDELIGYLQKADHDITSLWLQNKTLLEAHTVLSKRFDRVVWINLTAYAILLTLVILRAKHVI